MPSRRVLVALIVAMLLVGDARAFAQYFGRNKVQHRDFDFKVAVDRAFRRLLLPRAGGLRGHVARMAERWYARLNWLFGTVLTSRQPLILYASSADFRQTNTVSGDLGEGTGGVTEGLRRRIIMPSAGSLAGTDHVLGHELVHAFQYDIGGGCPSRNPGSCGCRSGWSKDSPSTSRSAASIRKPPCGFATRSSATRSRPSRTSATRGSSRTASATRSGRTSPDGGTTAPSCCCSTRP